MSEHVVLNIRLPQELHNALKARATQEDRSLAGQVRAILRHYLAVNGQDLGPTCDSCHQPLSMSGYCRECADAEYGRDPS